MRAAPTGRDLDPACPAKGPLRIAGVASLNHRMVRKRPAGLLARLVPLREGRLHLDRLADDPRIARGGERGIEFDAVGALLPLLPCEYGSQRRAGSEAVRDLDGPDVAGERHRLAPPSPLQHQAHNDLRAAERRERLIPTKVEPSRPGWARANTQPARIGAIGIGGARVAENAPVLGSRSRPAFARRDGPVAEATGARELNWLGSEGREGTAPIKPTQGRFSTRRTVELGRNASLRKHVSTAQTRAGGSTSTDHGFSRGTAAASDKSLTITLTSASSSVMLPKLRRGRRSGRR